MRCLARTKKLHRCKNDGKPRYLFFCHAHRFQSILYTLSLIGLIAMFGGLYQDVIKPIGGKFSHDKNKSEPLIVNDSATFSPTDSTDNLKILLLPFKPDINCTELDIDYQGQILERLQSKKENEELNIQLLILKDIDCPVTHTQARNLGAKKYADIVIWGSYEEDNEGVKGLRIRYTIVNESKTTPDKVTGDTGMQDISELYQLREGYLQNDIDFVIYWIEGRSAYKRGNFKEAISKFNEIVKLTRVRDRNN